MPLEFEPVPALAPLGLVLDNPHPLDSSIALIADASHHAVGVQGIDNVGILLRTLAARDGLHKEGILKEGQEIH